eukprot:scaffold52129_cov58-Phaeocystis_antarctica.AAC.1
MKRPRDRGGPKMEWARQPSVRWKPPPLRVVCGSGREDSLPHRQKKRIAHRVSVDQPSLCAVYTKPVGRT